MQHQPSNLAGALRHLGTGAQPSYWKELHRLRIPVVVLAGTRDAKFTSIATRMNRDLPHSDLRLLDCGHVIHVEQPEAFSGALR